MKKNIPQKLLTSLLILFPMLANAHSGIGSNLGPAKLANTLLSIEIDTNVEKNSVPFWAVECETENRIQSLSDYLVDNIPLSRDSFASDEDFFEKLYHRHSSIASELRITVPALQSIFEDILDKQKLLPGNLNLSERVHRYNQIGAQVSSENLEINTVGGGIVDHHYDLDFILLAGCSPTLVARVTLPQYGETTTKLFVDLDTLARLDQIQVNDLILGLSLASLFQYPHYGAFQFKHLPIGLGVFNKLASNKR